MRSPQIPMDKVIAHELEILGSHGMQAFRYERDDGHDRGRQARAAKAGRQEDQPRRGAGGIDGRWINSPGIGISVITSF